MSYATSEGVLNAQWNAAEMAFQTEQARSAPHVLMRPTIFQDGNMWCAIYGDNLAINVAGFGETPELACVDFDKNWRGMRLLGEASSPATEKGSG